MMCHKWHLTLLTYEIYAIYIKITIKKVKWQFTTHHYIQ